MDLLEEEDEKKKEKKKDNRKRNSQLFALMDFIDATRNRSLRPDQEELTPLDYSTVSCANANAQKQKMETGKIDPRAARANKVADGVAQGNMRVMREQVIGHFTTINSEWGGARSVVRGGEGEGRAEGRGGRE